MSLQAAFSRTTGEGGFISAVLLKPGCK